MCNKLHTLKICSSDWLWHLYIHSWYHYHDKNHNYFHHSPQISLSPFAIITLRDNHWFAFCPQILVCTFRILCKWNRIVGTPFPHLAISLSIIILWFICILIWLYFIFIRLLASSSNKCRRNCLPGLQPHIFVSLTVWDGSVLI